MEMRRILQDITVHPNEGWIEYRFLNADTVHIDLKDQIEKVWDPMGDMAQALYMLVLEQRDRIDRLESTVERLDGNLTKERHRLRELMDKLAFEASEARYQQKTHG